MNLIEVAKMAIDSANGVDSVAQDEKATVNILVTSDIHTSGMSDIDTKGASIVIVAGDIMGGGMRSDNAGYRYLEDEFFPWCEKNADKEIVITAGNHDKFLFRMWEKEEKIPWPKNVHYLIDKKLTIKGLSMYGTPWCTRDREGRFEASSHDLADKFRQIPNGVDILISHTPPFVPGEKVDFYAGYHDGSPELTEAIMKKKPHLVICGHVHGGSREPIMIGSTKVVNVARVRFDRSKEAVKPQIMRISYDR